MLSKRSGDPGKDNAVNMLLAQIPPHCAADKASNDEALLWLSLKFVFEAPERS